MTIFYNHPTLPRELQVLKILNQRMTLPPESLTRLYNLQKGYEGEVKFHKLLNEHLVSDCIVLYDLLQDSKSSKFQIDCIIIQQSNIWYLEVKNFEGDFILKDKSFYNIATKKEVNNPLHQVDRGQRLLKETHEKYSFKYSIEPYVIFVSTEFSLYQLPLNLPIVLPTQIRRFIKKISNTSSKLSPDEYKYARKLMSIQLSESLHNHLPEYHSDHLRKGMHCLYCANSLVSLSHINSSLLYCQNCLMRESNYSAILRCVDEFRLLFPEQKVTTTAIWHWCGKTISKYKIRKALFRFFKPIGNQRGMHFVSWFKNPFSLGVE